MGCTQSSTSDSEDIVMMEADDAVEMDLDQESVQSARLRLLDLPLEMIVEVLTHVDNPRDLDNFLRASRSIYTAFKLRERVIRWSVLRNAFPGMNYHDAAYAIKADCMRRTMLDGRDTYDKRWVTPAEAGRIKVKWKAEAKAFLDGYHALTMTGSPYFGTNDAHLDPHDHTATDPMFKLWYLIDYFVASCANECSSNFRDQLTKLSEQEERQRIEWRRACETEAANKELNASRNSASMLQDVVYESRLIASEPLQGLTCHFEQTVDGPQLVIHQDTSSDSGSQNSDNAQSPSTMPTAPTSSSSDTQQSSSPSTLATTATPTPPKYDPLPDTAVVTRAFARPLSRHEYIRIQRAFLRLEIHRRTLPLAATTSYVFSHRFQGCRFFGGFTPWEREEMLCAHKFLRRYTRRMLNLIRSTVMSDLLHSQHDTLLSTKAIDTPASEKDPQPDLVDFNDDILRDIGWSSLISVGTGMYASLETEIQRMPLLGLPFLRLLETSELQQQRDLLNDHGFWRRHWHRHILLPSALIKSNAHDTHPSAISNSRRHVRRSAESSSEEKAMALPSAGWRWSRPSKLEQMARELKRRKKCQNKQDLSSLVVPESPTAFVDGPRGNSVHPEVPHVIPAAIAMPLEQTTTSTESVSSNVLTGTMPQTPESLLTAATLTIPIHPQPQDLSIESILTAMASGASESPPAASTSNPPILLTETEIAAVMTSVSSSSNPPISTGSGVLTAAGLHTSTTTTLTAPVNTNSANTTASGPTSPETSAECRKRNECARAEDSKLWPMGYVFWGKKRLAEAGVLERDVQDLVADIAEVEAIEIEAIVSRVKRYQNVKLRKSVLDALKLTGNDVVLPNTTMRTLGIVEACEY